MDHDDDAAGYYAVAALAKISVGVEPSGIETVMFGPSDWYQKHNGPRELLDHDLLMCGKRLAYVATAPQQLVELERGKR